MRNGYSLLELMVSLAVISVVVTLGLSSLDFGRSSWEKGARAAGETSDRILISRALRDLIARTTMGFGGFDGQSDSLAFTALMPPYPTPAGAYRVALRIEQDGPVSTLTVQRVMANANPDAPLWDGMGDPSILYRLDGTMRFAYLEEITDLETITRDWRDDWTLDQPPPLVALRIAPTQGDPWEILTAPGVSLAASCISGSGAGERPQIREDCR